MAISVIYDVSTHPFLTKMAAELHNKQPDQFAAYNLGAETLLGLDTELTTVDRAAEQLKLAVAMQVNFMLAQGIDGIMLDSIASSQTKQSLTYRELLCDPRALQLVNSIYRRFGGTGKFTGTITSKRFEGN